MTAETEAERQQREDDFHQRMKRDGDLGLMLCEHLWGSFDTLHLGGEDFEIVSGEEVPGYEDDDGMAVLLRRKSDGKVFEAEIDVAINPVRVAAEVTR
jgi:hypothetical protein